MMIEQHADGELEFQFNGEFSIVDPKSPAVIATLVQLIVTLDARLARLEK